MLKLRIERVGTIDLPPDPTLNPRVEVWRDNEGLIAAYGETLGEECRMHLPGLASFRFSARGDEIAAAVSATIREECVIDAYLRKVLPMALQVRGREVLHASAVRSPAGVIALSAVSNTGKSTIAFGLSRRGYPLWADDAVVFEISDGGAGVAVSLPFEVRLRASAAEFFSLDRTKAPAAASNKALPFDAQTAPLAAVCVLRRFNNGGALPVSVRRLSSADAFASVLTHAHCFSFDDVERKGRMMHNYLNLVATTPVFDVCFQPGLTNLPNIFEAIEQVSEQCAQRGAHGSQS